MSSQDRTVVFRNLVHLVPGFRQSPLIRGWLSHIEMAFEYGYPLAI
jgi:hypothetical protein